MIALDEVMIELRPNHNWKIINGEIIWKDDIDMKPSEEEMEIKKNELEMMYPMKLLREKRDELLEETDKYFILDWPHKNEEDKQSWINYRQSLRDLPNTSTPQMNDGILTNVDWPLKPF